MRWNSLKRSGPKIALLDIGRVAHMVLGVKQERPKPQRIRLAGCRDQAREQGLEEAPVPELYPSAHLFGARNRSVASFIRFKLSQ
jgi:hypothetical protein